MPDLAFSNTNSVGVGWTVQQVDESSAAGVQDLGYEAKEPAEDKKEDVDGK
jgi:hypothetical protein